LNTCHRIEPVRDGREGERKIENKNKNKNHARHIGEL
jgi:hypothetical protein